MQRNGLVIIALWAVMILNALATNVYVRVPGGNAAQYPYTSWAMAATNIQDAVDAINTNGGNYVFVSNGTYYLADQITIAKGITLQSWNQGVPDQTNTIIHGNNYPEKLVTNRCIFIRNASPVGLVGFTITKGVATNAAVYGGGVYATNSSYYFADCIVTGNVADNSGGGIYTSSSTGTIERCVISRNYADDQAGGMLIGGSSIIIHQCVISFNTCGAYGGGAYLTAAGEAFEARECSVISNLSKTLNGGGGLTLRGGPVARNCLITGNTAGGSLGGGGVIFWYNSYGANSKVINCTITGNSATTDKGGGIATSEASTYFVENSIVYGNLTGGAGVNSNYYEFSTGKIRWTNSCSVPSLNEISPGTNVNNIAADPQFAAAATGNYRLARSSPCVNAGTNRSWMTPEAGGLDLDGNRRIMMLTVDMGAYELAPPAGMILKFR